MRPIPKSLELVFKENPTHPGIYDLISSGKTPFKFIRLSEPRSEFLLRQGAKWVIESWNNDEKPLFSGLRQFREGLYYGDNLNNGKRSLMIVKMVSGTITIYLFKTYPKGKRFHDLIMHFPGTINPRHHPGVLSPTNPEEPGSVSNTNLL